MDLLSVMGTLWKHRWITVPIVCMTAGFAAAVVILTPAQYEAHASYVLVTPPIPTETDLARDPSLEKLNKNNPYLRFGSQSMVSQVIASRVDSDTVRKQLQKAGAGDKFTISPSDEFGGAGQILSFTGVGSTPDQARKSARLVIDRAVSELRTMQKVYGADDRYLITALPVEPPGEVRARVSGKMRTIIGVVGAGAIALFAAISFAEAVGTARRDARARKARAAQDALDAEPDAPGSEPAESESDATPRGVVSSVEHRRRERERERSRQDAEVPPPTSKVAP